MAMVRLQGDDQGCHQGGNRGKRICIYEASILPDLALDRWLMVEL